MSINTETLHLQISEDLKQRVRQYARAKGLPITGAVRVLLDLALAAEGIPQAK